MIKIDLKDRKILYQLDINSRQPYSKIGKKVGLPKKNVDERINRLINEGIIKAFYSVIDVYKLGYIIMRFHYKYQYINKEIEKEIIEYFMNDKNSVLIASCSGLYNLKVIRIIKEMNEFYDHWHNIQNKYGYYFQNRSSSLFIDEMYYDYSFLLNDINLIKREKVTLIGRGKRFEIDDFDFQLLKNISANSRITLYELAEILNKPSNIIKKHIENLEKIGIIRGFRIDIDISKLGYNIFRAHIFLNDYNMRKDIINYIRCNPNLVFIDTYTGEADLEFEFYLKNINNFHEIMDNLSSKFPQAIKNFQSLHINNYHKFLYMPESK